MPRLGLCLAQRQEQVLCFPEDAATTSVFPRVERWLMRDKHACVLVYVTAMAPADQYRSIIDWLFCTMFPAWKPHCFAYYREEGPPLRDAATKRKLAVYEKFMLRVLEHLLQKHQEHEQDLWTAALLEAKWSAKDEGVAPVWREGPSDAKGRRTR